MTYALEALEVCAGYGAAQILHGVSLVVRHGEFVVLIGPNGAGKSTLLKTIAGLIRPSSGNVLADGTPIAGLPAEKLARRGIVLVPQTDNVFPSLTVSENLRLASEMAPSTPGGGNPNEALALFPELRAMFSVRAGLLSGGQRQALAIARALMMKPRCLLLDEPTAGLMAGSVKRVLDAVRSLASNGLPVLMVEQKVHEALRVADRAYLLKNGRNAIDGPAKDFAARPEIELAYLGDAAGDLAAHPR